MNRSVITIAVGAAVGAGIGVLIGELSHLAGYWPHVVVAACAAGGVFVCHAMWPHKG